MRPPILLRWPRLASLHAEHWKILVQLCRFSLRPPRSRLSPRHRKLAKRALSCHSHHTKVATGPLSDLKSLLRRERQSCLTFTPCADIAADRFRAPLPGSCQPPCGSKPDRPPFADHAHHPDCARPDASPDRPHASCHPDQSGPVPAPPRRASTAP